MKEGGFIMQKLKGDKGSLIERWKMSDVHAEKSTEDSREIRNREANINTMLSKWENGAKNWLEYVLRHIQARH